MNKKNTIEQPITPSLKGKSIVIKSFNVLLQPLKVRHERHYRDSQFHLWADIILATLLVGAAILLIWLLVWQPKAAFSLDLHTSTSRVVSGQSQEFIIDYKNQEGDPIQAANLAVKLPDNFIFESATPTTLFDVPSQTFLLGDLAEGERGKLKLQGIIRGSIGDSQTIGLNLFYQHSGIRKQLLSSFVYQIDDSALTLSLDIPETAFQNIPSPGVIEVKNIGHSTLDNAAIAFVSPDWEVTPENEVLENGRLVLPSLEPGETRYLNFSALTEVAEGQIPFTVEGQIITEDSILKQVELTRQITITEPSLSMTTSWNETSFSGQEARLNLGFKNNNQAEISDITFAFQSNRESMALTKVSSSNQNFNVGNNILSYTKSLSAGASEKGIVDLSFERKNVILNDFLSVVITVSYVLDGQTLNYLITSPNLKINSNLSVSSGGYYYSPQGDQLGVGPLPPKVDIPTTYWVIWEANNLGNDISNFEVSADLLANVVWLDQKSLVIGEINYSPINRRILWQVDKLSQTGGNYRASFAISIVPSQNELGTVPTLLSNISLLGHDEYSGGVIFKKLANITTNIENDRQAAGKGKVESLD